MSASTLRTLNKLNLNKQYPLKWIHILILLPKYKKFEFLAAYFGQIVVHLGKGTYVCMSAVKRVHPHRYWCVERIDRLTLWISL